eukprot:11260537-Ditylum_brightwellii.AAC.1
MSVTLVSGCFSLIHPRQGGLSWCSCPGGTAPPPWSCAVALQTAWQRHPDSTVPLNCLALRSSSLSGLGRLPSRPMAEATVLSTSPAWSPSSHKSMRLKILAWMSLDHQMPGVVCKTTVMNTMTCSEFQCWLQTSLNSAVRMVTNLLSTSPLGTLYQLVRQLT